MDTAHRGTACSGPGGLLCQGISKSGNVARAAVAALQSHSIRSGTPLMPSASMSGPNGLAELAAHARQHPVSRDSNTLASSGCSRHELCGLDEGGSMIRSFTGADSTPADRQLASEGILGRLAGTGTGMDPDLTFVVKQRLKARLHLEVLRVLQWCFHFLDLQFQTYL